MAKIEIDKLSLKLSGLSRSDGERLARLLAHGLGRAMVWEPAAHEIPVMSINVRFDGQSSLSRLSDQIVSEVLRELRR